MSLTDYDIESLKLLDTDEPTIDEIEAMAGDDHLDKLLADLRETGIPFYDDVDGV